MSRSRQQVLEIQPTSGLTASQIRLPGSKYIANRVLPLCAMAVSPSRLTNVVSNNDIKAAIEGLSGLGYQLKLESDHLVIQPRASKPDSQVCIDTAHSGTFSRFVTAIAALETVDVRISCSDKMATRPMRELFDSLQQLGVSIESPNGRLPAVIKGPIANSVCQLDSRRSSQYVSALLMVAPLTELGIEIQMPSKGVSNSYIEMTLDWMRKLGISIDKTMRGYRVKGGQSYQGITAELPGDAVSASYFMGLVGIVGGQLRIQSFDFASKQGEAKFYHLLEKMGMSFKRDNQDLIVSCEQGLKSIEVDMSEMPDVVQTLAVMASYAEGTTRINNIGHLAFKESNRIKDTACELRKAGIQVEDGEDYLVIQGGQPKGATIETYDDHRMAMSMGLLGAKTSGIRIIDPDVVAKSFPSYWQLMASCGLLSKKVDKS
ncbi:MAG: 3-phosphoshikimate 1-carboxyvinyltransferase [Enterobacterales bacterium]|nr:3-phosphoshikimate 1-carboxyvinyltransferase [Enterobacterales bacterium]